MATAPSEPTKLATGIAGRPTAPSVQPNVMASIAPSAAPAETPSVNGVASGLRSSPWKTTPADASAGADQRAGERARQARDEEDLRVDVVGERHGRVERAAQADRRRADERRDDDRRQRQRAEAGHRRDEPPPDGAGHGTRSASRAANRRDDEMPGCGVQLHVGVDAVQRRECRRREHARGRPGREHAPVLEQHERASTGSPRSSGRGSRARSRAAGVAQLAQQRGNLELIREVERRRRLVEQQQRAAGPPAADGDLRQRGGDRRRAASRRRSASRTRRSSNASRAGGGERLRAPPRSRAGPRSRTRRDAGSGPSARLRARV